MSSLSPLAFGPLRGKAYQCQRRLFAWSFEACSSLRRRAWSASPTRPAATDVSIENFPPGDGDEPPCGEGTLGFYWQNPNGYWYKCVRGAFGYEWINTRQRWDCLVEDQGTAAMRE